jgi:hypothetical protein
VPCVWICCHGKENSSVHAIVTIISFTVLFMWVDGVQWPRRIFESLLLWMIFKKKWPMHISFQWTICLSDNSKMC